ncbi:hypothetical protein GCM10025760_10160 [Microbacterium yannicii]|uniref:Uncharacterized protein n=1 Tax=Microbacterium yannicii TaxID=671622 RepID=A0ABP9M3F2_9MICO
MSWLSVAATRTGRTPDPRTATLGYDNIHTVRQNLAPILLGGPRASGEMLVSVSQPSRATGESAESSPFTMSD